MAAVFYSSALILISIEQIVNLQGRGQAGAISMYTNSEDEDAALTEFRELAVPLAYRTFMKSDGYLIRWLIQTDFDVEEAFKNFKETLEWRHRKRVDHVVFEEFPLLEEEVPYSLDILDKDGRPVILTPLGRHDVRKITIAGGENSYMRYLLRMYEMVEIYLHHIRTTVNPNVTQAITIQDLAGFNLKTVGCLRCINMIPEVVTDVDPNYPRLYYKGFIINMPKIFQTALGLILKVLSEKSRATLQAFGHDKNEWMPVLHEQIPLEQLPTEYGGTKANIRGKTGKDVQRKSIQQVLLARAKDAVTQDMQAHSDSDEHASSVRESVPAPIVAEADPLKRQDMEPTELQDLSQHDHRHNHHHHYKTTTPPSDSNIMTAGYVGHGNETKGEPAEPAARSQSVRFWNSGTLLHLCLHSFVTAFMHFVMRCSVSN